MAIPEDIDEQWNEFPSHVMKIDPPDYLFGSDFDDVLAGEFVDTPPLIESFGEVEGEGEGEDVVTADSVKKPNEPEVEETMLEVEETMLEVVGSDASVLGGICQPSARGKLFAREDFVSFLSREGGLDRDSLAKLVGDVSPMPDEDFVAFMARANGINDEKMIERLRQALNLEPVIEFRSSRTPVKIKEEDEELQVREGEDAASYLARTVSRGSSMSEELFTAGLEEITEEEYSQTFLGRNERTSGGGGQDGGDPVHGSQDGSTNGFLHKQNSFPSRGSMEFDSAERIILKKRKATIQN